MEGMTAFMAIRQRTTIKVEVNVWEDMIWDGFLGVRGETTQVWFTNVDKNRNFTIYGVGASDHQDYSSIVSRFENVIPDPQISKWSYTNPTCSKLTYQSQFFAWVSDRETFWMGLTTMTLQMEAVKVKTVLAGLEGGGGGGSGDGIVYSCHPGIVTHTLVSIRVIRTFGCTLPVQLWYG